MTVLIPLNIKHRYESVITNINECKTWVFIQLEEGQIVKYDFYTNKDDIKSWIDYIIIINSQEYVWQFIEDGICVLVAPIQKSIDDIIEAFLFKELHDINI